MEEVQIHNEKCSLLTSQSLTSLHTLCTIALHVDIHLVCDFMGERRDCWQISLCLWLRKAPPLEKAPCSATNSSHREMWRIQFQNNSTKDFTLWPWPYSIHALPHSYTFSHHVPIVHTSIIHSCTRALICLCFCCVWSGGSASMNKIAK